jgi:pyruvate/2-oxoglutarate/acetoin dehydrogenase E1 component
LGGFANTSAPISPQLADAINDCCGVHVPVHPILDAKDIADKRAGEGMSANVVDPRTVSPPDTEIVRMARAGRRPGQEVS